MCMKASKPGNEEKKENSTCKGLTNQGPRRGTGLESAPRRLPPRIVRGFANVQACRATRQLTRRQRLVHPMVVQEGKSPNLLRPFLFSVTLLVRRGSGHPMLPIPVVGMGPRFETTRKVIHLYRVLPVHVECQVTTWVIHGVIDSPNVTFDAGDMRKYFSQH